jgi:hypothetical protein
MRLIWKYLKALENFVSGLEMLLAKEKKKK